MALEIALFELVNQHILRFIEALAESEQQRHQMLLLWRDSAGHIEADTPPQRCAHILLSGPSIGKKCGKAVSSKSRSRTYCTAHLVREHNQTGTGDPPKKLSKLMERVKIILFKSIEGHLVDPNTRLVFDASKLAIGKEQRGVIVPLGPEDLDFCLKQKIPVKCPSKKGINQTDQ